MANDGPSQDRPPEVSSARDGRLRRLGCDRARGWRSVPETPGELCFQHRVDAAIALPRSRSGQPLKNQISVGGELNKLPANIGSGRNHAFHWRSDYSDSLPLDEALVISILRDQRHTYNESFSGFTFTKFDRSRVTV